MLLCYAPDIQSDNYMLSAEESKHCVRVLRMNNGDMLHLTDGKGSLYQAQIIEADVRRCRVNIVSVQQDYNTRNYYLHLAVAPTKNIERYEQLLEKATETGIDEITPLICDHSERLTVNADRLEKILVAAMKQSLKTRLPRLNSPVPFKEIVYQYSNSEKFIGCCNPNIPRKIFWQAIQPSSRLLIFIGPEGDFSDNEIQQALQNGFCPITFGNSRFRVETAGMLACIGAYIINLK